MFGHRHRPPSLTDMIKRLEKNLDAFRANFVEQSRQRDERILQMALDLSHLAALIQKAIDIITSGTGATDALNAKIAEQEKELQAKDASLAEKDKDLSDTKALIADLEAKLDAALSPPAPSQA